VDVPAPNPDTLTPEDTTAAPPVLGEDSAAEPPAGTGQEAP
jgi:hypothetical protein